MSSLFSGSSRKRRPNKDAKYLGKDGSGNDQWEIMGQTFTGSVTTVGNKAPTIGMSYPGLCQDPDSWRGWAVLCSDKSRPARPFSVPETIALLWYSEQAGFDRSNSQVGTGATLDPEALTTATAPGGNRYDRWLGDYRARLLSDRIEVPTTPGTTSPNTRWWYNSEEAEAIADMAAIQAEWDTYAEDDSSYTDENNYYTVNHVVSGITQGDPISCSIVGDQIFLELDLLFEIATTIIEVTDGETTYEDAYTDYPDPVRILVVLSSNPGEAATIPVQWGLNLSETLPEIRDPRSDVVVTGGRVALLCQGPALYHCSAVDGEDMQEVDLSAVVACADNSLDILAPCIGDRWVNTYARNNDGRIWSGGLGVALFCASLTSNSLLWVRDPADDHIYLHPVGFHGGDLVCGCEKLLMEEITNNVMGLTWEPTTTPVNVTQLQGGHSHLAGLCYLNPNTGAELGFTEFDGAPVDNGERLDPFTDYYHALATWTWTTGANDPSTYYPTGYNPPYNSGSVLWIIPPDLTDFYNGPLEDPYQETNSTGTYGEGPASEGGVGDFHGVEDKAQKILYSPNFAYQQPAINDAYDALVNQVIDGMNQLRGSMVAIEQEHRQGPADYIRASVVRYSASVPLGLAEPAIGADPPYIYTGAEEFTWTVVNKSQIEREGTRPPAPTIKTRLYEEGESYTSYSFTGVGGDHSYPSPDLLGQRVGWSDQYRAWQASRTSSTEPPDPWPNQYGGTLPLNTGGGDQMYSNEILIWRPVSTTPRTKTPTPNLTLGPCTSHSGGLVLGPRFVDGSPPEWFAVAGRAKAWSTSAPSSVSAFPGPPVSVETPSGVGIFTGYQVGSTHLLSVIDASDGTLIDEVEVTEYLREALFGDGALWKQQSRTFGLTS